MEEADHVHKYGLKAFRDYISITRRYSNSEGRLCDLEHQYGTSVCLHGFLGEQELQIWISRFKLDFYMPLRPALVL